MKEMRSSGEVMLPKMRFRLGAAAGNEENAFCLYIYEGNAFISGRLGQVGQSLRLGHKASWPQGWVLAVLGS